ncbi:hypothetical protein U3516DRAFT_735646 [Neocallimastix sp. 'constans']
MKFFEKVTSSVELEPVFPKRNGLTGYYRIYSTKITTLYFNDTKSNEKFIFNI